MPGESTSHVVGSPRRLAAILAADISGYSRLMGSDEEGTLARLKRHRREIIEPTIQEHYGRIIKTTGDGFLAMFDSPLEAVRCAELRERVAATDAERAQTESPGAALQAVRGVASVRLLRTHQVVDRGGRDIGLGRCRLGGAQPCA